MVSGGDFEDHWRRSGRQNEPATARSSMRYCRPRPTIATTAEPVETKARLTHRSFLLRLSAVARTISQDGARDNAKDIVGPRRERGLIAEPAER
jgi:hypothetical protein